MNQLRGPTQIKLDGVSVKPREIGQNRQIFGAFYVHEHCQTIPTTFFPASQSRSGQKLLLALPDLITSIEP